MAQPDTLLEVELERDDKNTTLFEAEKKAFWALRGQLLDQYEGQYVAIHQGRVVDHDTDKLKLGLRVYWRFGYQPIYVQLVSRQGLPVKWLSSPLLLTLNCPELHFTLQRPAESTASSYITMTTHNARQLLEKR
jgi:hypothetical protein